jgi:hypothetical protein
MNSENHRNLDQRFADARQLEQEDEAIDFLCLSSMGHDQWMTSGTCWNHPIATHK